MKIIIPFLATIFCAAISLAQEESASPAESTAPATEEKASATVEETPVVKPAKAAAPAAEKKAEAATAKPAASEAAAKKEATAATAEKPAAAAAAPATSTKGMSVKDLENRWEAAVGKHDVAAVQPMIANDFIGVYTDRKVMSKSAVLGMYKKDKDTYKSAKNEKLEARSVGPNVTVVVGTAREKGTGKDGTAFDRTYRFTDTWVMRNGQWQCVASQVMKMKG